MERVDLKKLEVAIKYVDRITKGCNPVNNLPLEEKEALNNPNVVRCMEFIREVLEAVKNNDGMVGKSKRVSEVKLRKFPYDTLKEFKFEKDKPISKFVEQVCHNINKTDIMGISYKVFTKWLSEQGYLEEHYSEKFEHKITTATIKGESVGIYNQEREGKNGKYIVVMYNENAQMFLIEKFKEIIEQ